MAATRIASRYSKSLLDWASEKGDLEAVKADMELVSEVCADSSDLRNLLRSPIIGASDKKSILSNVFKSTSKTTQEFIHFMVDKRRESALSSVATQFIESYDKLKGIAKVTVVSAVALSDDTLQQVEKYVGGMIEASTIELTNTIDPSIIGGLVIKNDDKLLDMSVSRELREIRKTLIYN